MTPTCSGSPPGSSRPRHSAVQRVLLDTARRRASSPACRICASALPRPHRRNRHGQVRTHLATRSRRRSRAPARPAFFVHPAEASHGDLGMITPDDVVLAVSNSGETAGDRPDDPAPRNQVAWTCQAHHAHGQAGFDPRPGSRRESRRRGRRRRRARSTSRRRRARPPPSRWVTPWPSALLESCGASRRRTSPSPTRVAASASGCCCGVSDVMRTGDAGPDASRPAHQLCATGCSR